MYRKRNLTIDINKCNVEDNDEMNSYYEIKNVNMLREFLGKFIIYNQNLGITHYLNLN
jgi:hypothetical protein